MTDRKRYMLFADPKYYPQGGRNEARAMFDSIEDAVREGERLLLDRSMVGANWYDILDMDTGEWNGDAYNASPV